MKKRRRKKIVIITVVTLLIAVLIVSSVYLIPKMIMKPVEVYPVSRIREYYFGGPQMGCYGIITAGSFQNIYPYEGVLIDTIYVQEGDPVKVGDTLLKYDLNIQNLNIKTIQINIDILKNRIKKTNNELDIIKTLAPSSPPPPPKMPEKLITDGEELNNQGFLYFVVSGTGTSPEDPFVFNVLESVTIPPSFFNAISGVPTSPSYYAELRVFYSNFVLTHSWKIDGAQFQDLSSRALTEGINVSSGVYVNSDDSISINNLPNDFGEFKQLAVTVDYIGGPHYSRDEIDKMRINKENELAGLKTELKQTCLNLEIEKDKYGDGIVLSEIDGVVSSIKSLDDLLPGEALMTIQSETGYQAEGTVSEFNLGKVFKGQEIIINSWANGMTYTGNIISISDLPVPSSSSMGSENPINTYYPFTASIDTNDMLIIGDWVEIFFSDLNETADNEDAIFIPNAFIREEGMQYYTYISDSNNKLKKQYIKTGRSNYGYSTEIVSGITIDDYIAFPYGKNIKEGAPTIIAEDSIYG